MDMPADGVDTAPAAAVERRLLRILRALKHTKDYLPLITCIGVAFAAVVTIAILPALSGQNNHVGQLEQQLADMKKENNRLEGQLKQLGDNHQAVIVLLMSCRTDGALQSKDKSLAHVNSGYTSAR